MRWYVKLGWALVLMSTVLWPISHFAPQSWKEDIILALSWVAILLTGIGILVSVYIKQDTEAIDTDSTGESNG